MARKLKCTRTCIEVRMYIVYLINIHFIRVLSFVDACLTFAILMNEKILYVGCNLSLN